MGRIKPVPKLGFRGGASGKEKNPPANADDLRDAGWIPGTGRSPGGGPGNPLQYSCLENPVDRGAWQVIVHSVTESDTTEVTQHAGTQRELHTLLTQESS